MRAEYHRVRARDGRKRTINRNAKRPGQGVFVARANAQNMDASYAVWLRYGPKTHERYDSRTGTRRLSQRITPLYWLTNEVIIDGHFSIAKIVENEAGVILEQELEKKLQKMLDKKIKKYGF